MFYLSADMVISFFNFDQVKLFAKELGIPKFEILGEKELRVLVSRHHLFGNYSEVDQLRILSKYDNSLKEEFFPPLTIEIVSPILEKINKAGLEEIWEIIPKESCDETTLKYVEEVIPTPLDFLTLGMALGPDFAGKLSMIDGSNEVTILS